MDMQDVSAGDCVKFRCGGVVKVAEIREEEQSESPFYFLVRISGYHLVDDWWCFSEEGAHGDATGPTPMDHGPFDIVDVF